MEVFTPVMLRDLYAALSKENRDTFLKRIAPLGSGREALLMVGELPKSEQFEFSNRTFAVVIKDVLPILIHHARFLTKERPDLANDEFEKEPRSRVDKWAEDAACEIGALEKEKLKEARDVKPRFEKRDDEIVRLRDEILPNGKQRTFGQVLDLIIKDWPTTQTGKPLTRDAVFSTYNRRKNSKTPSGALNAFAAYSTSFRADIEALVAK